MAKVPGEQLSNNTAYSFEFGTTLDGGFGALKQFFPDLLGKIVLCAVVTDPRRHILEDQNGFTRRSVIVAVCGATSPCLQITHFIAPISS
jgi:hypothetical protein